ncbi:MAG: hypothetical protein ACD_2C00026G0002, partial [uncultured bacterium (gcode 4)]
MPFWLMIKLCHSRLDRESSFIIIRHCERSVAICLPAGRSSF